MNHSNFQLFNILEYLEKPKSQKMGRSSSCSCKAFEQLTPKCWTAGASPAGGRGGIAPPILVFAPPPPDLFLAPPQYFLGGKSCCFWPEKTFKFVILDGKSLRISAKTFFFVFWDHLILAGKSLRISAKTFFFWRSLDIDWKKSSNFDEDLFFFFWRSPDFH